MIQVTCAVIFDNDKILVTQRGVKQHQPFLWEFPGGKIESGETAESCILRELFEELGIHVRLKGKLKKCNYDYGSFQVTLIPFIAEIVSGTITLHEHMNFSWMKPGELKSLDWTPADIAIVNQVMEYCGVHQ